MIDMKIDDLKSVLDDFNDAKPKAVLRALVSTVNKLAAQGKTEASRKIREEYNIKARDLSRSILIRKANAKTPKAEIIGRGKQGIPLVLFGGKWTRPGQGKRGMIRGSKVGASVMVRKGNRKTLPGTFIATMKSGRQNIFERAGGKRLPIKQFFGPQPALLLGVPRVIEAVRRLIQAKAGEIFRHEWDYFNNK